MLVKVSSPNKQGQVVIPAKIRNSLGINENTLLKIYEQLGKVCIEILRENSKKNINKRNIGLVNFANFPKEKNQKQFQFKGQYSDSKSLAQDVDEIIYK